jgi:DNA-binding response OmpR family regulator
MNAFRRNKTILIVDDDEEVAELIAVFIKNQGYDTVVKYDAASTKKWLSSGCPDLVLMDIMLPDTTGIEFSDWFNKQERFKGIPIIHITGFLKDDVAKMDSVISGASDFIIKPIDFMLLENKIKALLKEKY